MNGACNITTGQCLCRPHVALISDLSTSQDNITGPSDMVSDGTCSICQPGFYGISTEVGCVQCHCNQHGSSGQQCDESGQCPCKDSVIGLKCDVCKDGFFGFTTAGCSFCNCSISGATSSNCNQTTGACTCKTNVEGHKCNDCKNGFFNLASYNPDGCQPCFCYGHGQSCTSAQGFVATVLQMTTFQYEALLGDHHISYGLNVTLGLSSGYLLNVSNETLLSFSGNGKSISHKGRIGTVIVPGETLLYVVQLLEHSWVLQEELQETTALDVLEILANVTKVGLITRSKGQAVTVTYLGLQSAEKVTSLEARSDVNVTYVEQCTCSTSDHVEGLSCERCAIGHMRANLSNISSYDLCVPCQCQGRGVTDPPECQEQTGLCLNCRNGTRGDHCEKCADFVVGDECSNCNATYWGLQADGCRACNCSSPGSLELECDQYSGQCRCASHVDGRTCDQCQENFQGLSTAGCTECDVCYSVMKTEILPLREQQSSIFSNVTNTMLESQDVTTRLGSFTSRLLSAGRDADLLVNFVTSIQQSASEFSTRMAGFNTTLELVQQQIAGSENMTLTIEQNLTLADTCLKQARSHRADMEAQVTTVYTDIASLQVGILVLEQLTRSFRLVESHLQSLAGASTVDQEVLGYLTTLNQTVFNTGRLMHEISQKSQDASKVHQGSTGNLLTLESIFVNLASRLSKTQSASRSLALLNMENKSTVKRLQDILAGLLSYVIDYATMTSRTQGALSLTSSFHSQVTAEASFFSPLNIKVLQSESLLEQFINGAQNLSSAASHLLWLSNDAQQRTSIIQNETNLLLVSAQTMLATVTNFSAQADEVQQKANTSLNQLISVAKQSQELTEQASNLTDWLVLLKQSVTAAKETSQQAMHIVQDKQQKLLSLSEQAEKFQARMSSVVDVSKEFYKILNNTHTNISIPAQQQCLAVSDSVSELRDQLSMAESVTNEAVQKVSNVTQGADQMLAVLNNMKSLDTSSALELLDQVFTARASVDLENLRITISQLQTSRNTQRTEIARLSALSGTLRNRVLNLQLLQEQRIRL